MRSYGAPLSEIDHSDLAFGFICALVLIVNSLARRSTYDRAPDQLTSTLHNHYDPAVRYGRSWDPAVRFWGFEATTTYSHDLMTPFNLATTISSLDHVIYAIPA